MKKILLTYLICYLFSNLLGCSKKQVDFPENKSKDDQIVFTEIDFNPAKGCPDTIYKDWKTSEYVLPYPVGSAYRVMLSHCSCSYHSVGRPDQFVIDFEMSVGTMITAFRAGKAVFIEETGVDGGFPNNLAAIKHEDRMIAMYMHLTAYGAIVRVGDEVTQGQEIALSGNTGLAGYAHLHFVVVKGDYSYPYVSLPTTFKNTSQNKRSLALNTIYEAFQHQ